MFYKLLLPILLIDFLQFSLGETGSNLISNNMINLDKNLGAFYLESNIDLQDKNDIYFYYKLDKRLTNISPTPDYEKMGIEISYIDTNNMTKKESHTILSNSIVNLFDRYDSYYLFKDKFFTTEGILDYRYLPNSEIYSIKLNNDIITLLNISVYYGDNVVSINSCYLGKELPDINLIEDLPQYKNDELTYHLLYIDRVNYLTSNYGYSLSISYLKRHYRIIDPSNEKLYEIDSYYFTISDNGFLSPILDSRFYISVKSTTNNIEAVIEIKITDNLSPTIEKWNFDEITLDSDKLENINDSISEYILIKDNYSKGDFLIYKISCYDNDFISGKYYIYIQATDQFNNQIDKRFLISINDLTKPKISTLYSYIITSKNNIYSSDELLSYFIIEDRETLSSVIVTTNTYLGNETILGRYIFEVTATDKKFNSNSAFIYIEVKDEDASKVKNSYRTFYYKYQENIFLEEIVSILIYNEIIPKFEYSSFRIIEGEDISKNLDPGDYFFLIELSYDGDKYYEEFIIHISEKEVVTKIDKISFLDFIKKLLQEIKNIFSPRR